MAEALKHMFSFQKLKNLAIEVKKQYKQFDQDGFLRVFKTKKWDDAELNDRVRIVSESLHEFLNTDFKSSIEVLIPVSRRTPTGYFSIFFPDFVWRFGLNDFTTSMSALEEFTQTSSGEFAIRHFIRDHPERTMKQMFKWSNSKNVHKRRLSSEGCRPRLPWGMQLKNFVADPAPVLSILENLKDDPELYVRKSVANNLNDISKDHPELVLEIASRWIGNSENTDWIVRHALRTMLKAGNKRALALFGHHDAKDIDVRNFELASSKIEIGNFTTFSFSVVNTSNKARDCRIEFAIDYVKERGVHSRKVFQVTKTTVDRDLIPFRKKISFVDLTTRKHYAGKHFLHIIINGEVKSSLEFKLVAN